MNPKYKTFIDEWDYFCSRINFGDSALDNRAIVFMNMFVTMLDEVVEEAEEESKEDTLEEVEEARERPPFAIPHTSLAEKPRITGESI